MSIHGLKDAVKKIFNFFDIILISMKFVADRMLGKLAKLLRMIGYDAEYVKDADENAIMTWSEQHKVFLTRGRRFQNLKIDGIYFVSSNYPVHQLIEIIEKFKLELKDNEFFSRCLECNQKLSPAPAEDVQRRVPEYVQRTKKEFFICPKCRRIYWEGTHRNHMQEIIDTVKQGLKRK